MRDIPDDERHVEVTCILMDIRQVVEMLLCKAQLEKFLT